MRCVLSIDTGGTKCDTLLAREDGTVLGWSHYTAHGQEIGKQLDGQGRSKQFIASAISEALHGQTCRELYIVGLSNMLLPMGVWEVSHAEDVHLLSIDEYAVPLALVDQAHGIVALAGTGAFVHGTTADGRELHLDALGPILGDYGGGYHIGMLAIHAAAKSGWHPRHQTSLAAVILQRYAGVTDDPSGFCLVPYIRGDQNRAEVASLAQVVNTHAEAGDPVAVAILQQAADSLAETLYDLVDRLGIAGEQCALVGTGGVVERSRIYWERFCTRAQEIVPHARPVLPQFPPAVGLALLQLKKLAAVDAATLTANLFTSACAFIGGMQVEEV